MRYVKKPIPIEAHQWWRNGDHPDDYVDTVGIGPDGQLTTNTAQFKRDHDWEGSVVRRYRRPDDSGARACTKCLVSMHEHGWIDTLEGGHVVCPGDWIVTGVRGERYPVKDEIFRETYEPYVEVGP